ncbi:hypothetical protein BJF79_15205 [Actinomadura sp. CNU-125]|nr:hypothetical protein BJF79_15205 [Actinomadura sp. CNU-125]
MLRVTPIAFARAWVDSPRARRVRTSRSRGVRKRATRSASPAGAGVGVAEALVDDDLARGDAAQDGQDVARLLALVGEAADARRDARVQDGAFEEAGQDDEAGVRRGGAQTRHPVERGAGGEPQVDEAHVGRPAVQQRQRVGGGVGHADDGVPGVGEDERQRVGEDRVVVADQHSHGWGRQSSP